MADSADRGSPIPRSALIEQTFVEHVQQLFAGEVTAQVLAEDVRGVGAYNDVIELPQRALLGQWLDLEHVERRPGEVAAPKRLDERRLIDHGAPPHVGEVRPLLDRSYRLGIEQPLRLGRAWQRYGDVVGLAKSAVQLRRLVQF